MNLYRHPSLGPLMLVGELIRWLILLPFKLWSAAVPGRSNVRRSTASLRPQ